MKIINKGRSEISGKANYLGVGRNNASSPYKSSVTNPYDTFSNSQCAHDIQAGVTQYNIIPRC